jgi:hypothetical protein
MKRQSPDEDKDAPDAGNEDASSVVDCFFVQPSSLPIVLFGNVKPGRVQEYLTALLPPVLADIVSEYTFYEFTSFGHPGFLLFIVDDQLILLHEEARVVSTPFVPRYISDEMDSSVGVWDIVHASPAVLRFERRKDWNGKPNDGMTRMVTTGISQVPRASSKDPNAKSTFVYVDEDGNDMFYGLEHRMEDVMIQNGIVSVRHDDSLTISKPTAGPVQTVTLTLPVELRDSQLDVNIGAGGSRNATITVVARGNGCDPVLYRTLPGGLALGRVYEDDGTVQLARLTCAFGWGYTFRRTKAGCLWLENDTVCLLRGVRSICSGGQCVLVDHATLGHQIISFMFDDTMIRNQLRVIAAKAAALPSNHITK